MSHSGSCASYSSEIRLNGQINQKLHWLNQKINYRDYTTMTVNKRLPMNGRLNGATFNRCQPYWGKLVGRVFQCPLAELGALPSPVFAVYLHMMMIVVVVMMAMMTMVMMDEPHCPWVIYNNGLYGGVQCTWHGRSEDYIQFLVLRRSLVGNVPLNVLRVMYSFEAPG